MDEDKPGPSGVAPPYRPKAAWAQPAESSDDDEDIITTAPPDRPRPKVAWMESEECNDDDGNQNNDDDPLANAWSDFAEKISVAGWKEAFAEPIVWIRQQYKVALIVFSTLSFYYTYQVVAQFVDSGYADEISDFVMLQSLPMSNVTICAQVYFNQTFIRDNLTITPDIWRKLAKINNNASQDDFYRQLALYLSPITRPKEIPISLNPLFARVGRTNPQVSDYINFARTAWPKCEEMLRKCRFDGREFECCKTAILSLDDDGVCFMLPLNMDSDNAYPSESTWRQHASGPDGGLTVEARLDVTDSPWLSQDAQNGFRVIVAPTPNSAIASPVCVPHGSETYIKVIAEKRVLASNCAPHGQLRLVNNQSVMYYDPEGESCALSNLIDTIAEDVAACRMAAYMYQPNASVVCQPRIVNLMGLVLALDNLTNILEKGIDSGAGTTPMQNKLDGEKKKQYQRLLEEKIRKIFDIKARCPNHCEYWTYQSTGSFNYLQQNDNENKDEAEVKHMFARIHVYYGNLDYRQHREIPETTVYLAFCDFGNVVGLYWGMSIVSFFHVFYYVSRYFYVKRQVRRRMEEQKKNQTTNDQFAMASRK